MRVLDLFSGIGGFSLGLERTGGFKTVAFCEISSFCRSVLAKHWPGVPAHDDVRSLQLQPGGADVIVGGFPCQDVSHAGQRAGLSGANSGLYRELMRAIRVVRPRHAIVENVAALRNDGLDTVLGEMAESGYDAEWDCVPAAVVGAPHSRDRIWIVAHAQSDRRGKRRPGRPPDSFARIRDQARQHARPEGCPTTWTDEPALLGVDDDVPDRVDRGHALGNSLVHIIPEMIGHALLESNGEG